MQFLTRMYQNTECLCAQQIAQGRTRQDCVYYKYNRSCHPVFPRTDHATFLSGNDEPNIRYNNEGLLPPL